MNTHKRESGRPQVSANDSMLLDKEELDGVGMVCELTIVVTSYNRSDRVGDAINSACLFAREIGSCEVVVVDDASTDDSAEVIGAALAVHASLVATQFQVLRRNLGVTGCKNAGAKLANGRWVVFLDSDDQLCAERAKAMRKALDAHGGDLAFFRCISADGSLVGPEQSTVNLTYREFIAEGTPSECLPVVRAAAIAEYPYDASLRGSDGLAYLRIARAGRKSVLISSLVLRIYDCSGSDQLSNGSRLRSRGLLKAHAHYMILREFGEYRSARRNMRSVGALIWNAGRWVRWRLLESGQERG